MGAVSQAGVWRFEQEADFYEMMAVLGATGLSSTAQIASTQEVVIRVFRGKRNGSLQCLRAGPQRYT